MGLARRRDSYRAYCIDQLVFYLGSLVESELNDVEGKTPEETRRKRQLVLDSFFSDMPGKITKGLYADPALLFGDRFTVTE